MIPNPMHMVVLAPAREAANNRLTAQQLPQDGAIAALRRSPPAHTKKASQMKTSLR